MATLSNGTVVVVHAQRLTTRDPVSQQQSSAPVGGDFVPQALAYAGGPGSLTNHLTFVGYAGTTMNAPGLDVCAESGEHSWRILGVRRRDTIRPAPRLLLR